MMLLAYIDPGVGSIIFQALVAGLLGVVIFFKTLRLRVTMFFSSLFGRGDAGKPHDPKP